ncbi:unnamed protein product [Peniophora sp. CBMAI 1063]|nr:unnamed protein product [Peniophora sp. CBMAI 1063]
MSTRFNELDLSDNDMDGDYEYRHEEDEDVMAEDEDEYSDDEDGDVGEADAAALSEIAQAMVDLENAADEEDAESDHESADGDALMLEDEDEDDDIEVQSVPASFLFRLLREARANRRPMREMPSFTKPHAEPQEAGVRLLMGGEFGRVRVRHDMRSQRHNVARQLLSRRSQLRPVPKQDIVQGLVPNTNGTHVAHEESNIYCAQFSADSSFYYTGTQDFKINVYDMSAPITQPGIQPTIAERRGHRRRPIVSNDAQSALKLSKSIQGIPGRWTMTDTHLSPDNERVIYSSLTPVVYMATTLDGSEQQIPINFETSRSRVPAWGYDEEYFRIYSTRFSADGKEIIAGGSGLICVYDLMANRRSVRIKAHEDDINSCCWADTASGNVLVSASDDTTLRVWDRRSLGSSQKASGVLIGHTEGITYVSAKGDGRYVISNGKDQTARLWDLRYMRSNHDWENVADKHYGIEDYDYRYGDYPPPRHESHPMNCSVMAFRGHQVLQTLIRCHFSPAETTGSQYIYSGSYDGRIHIWSLDGRIVQVLERSRSLPINFDPSAPEYGATQGEAERICVRDVSWHSREPVIHSAAFESSRMGSTVARHEWKGLTKTAGALEDWVEKDRLERAERPARRMPGQFLDEED